MKALLMLTTRSWLRVAVVAPMLLCGLWRPVEADGIDYNTARLERRLPAVRASGPIAIDGSLDETAWLDAPVATRFIQSEPKEGEAASEETEVRVLYDDTNLYLGVFAHDRHPAQIIVNELRKDFSIESADAFEVVLDTFHDERNGYVFGINAMGAKWDAQMVNEGRETNTNWDGIWSVRTRIVENGWSAELAIPFRTLKFASTSPQTWGVNFLRRVRRRNEESYWSPLPRIYRLTRVSLAGTLEGLLGVRPGRDLRVKPYALGSAGRAGAAGTEGDFDAGFDVKYGLTSSLTWDFTVNTDFSQVEADEQQINLTRFSLFFPEKRDFFLENSGAFQFGAGNERPGLLGGGGGGGVAMGGRQTAVQNDLILFFSRRIGLSDAGEAIPILGGTRLTGRVGGLTVGALNIQQRSRPGTPATNFSAVRLRQDILANSDIGVMILNKDVSGPRYNRVVGTDANFRFFRNLNLDGLFARTFSPAAGAGSRGDDATWRTGVSWRETGYQVRASYAAIGERFNDEMGFVPRRGINKATGYLGAHIRPKATARWLREISPHWEGNHLTRRTGGLDSRYQDFHLPFRLQDGSFVEIGLNTSAEEIARSFLINNRRRIFVRPGRYEFDEYFLLVYSNRAAPLSFNGRYAVGEFYDGYKHTYQIGATARVNERLNASANLSRNAISLSGGAFTTNLLSARVNYGFSTRMFLNALLQYNTDARQWTSNIRFNLIHRPLSDFFLVYNERHGDVIDRALVAKMTYLMAF